MGTQHLQRGRWGEDLAVRHLERLGLTVIDRNWRCREGEIDIVAGDEERDTIVICEVKSGVEDYRVDRKWHEYGPFCDAFYFAVAPEFPQDILPDEPGLIVADGFGGAVVRDAPVIGLAPAYRAGPAC